MCDYCDCNNKKSEIFQDQGGNYYLDVNTYQWDESAGDYIHRHIYISYCPYCGRDLYKKKEEKPVEEHVTPMLGDTYQDILEGLLREYKLSNPYPTYYPTNQQTSYVPACCRSCSKHPSNGGDGICNCAAPLFDTHNPWKITC